MHCFYTTKMIVYIVCNKLKINTMNYLWLKICLFLYLAFTSVVVTAESQWKLTKAEVTIHGTSNLHDWEMQVKEVKSQQIILFSGSQIVLNNVDLTVPVNRIESGNSVMDGKAREALKAGTFSTIRFTAGEVTLPVSRNSVKGIIKGKLHIAGVMKDVEIKVSGMISSDTKIILSGTYIIDMTQYDVKPPTALFGTLKTGKEVKISFTFELTQI